jgi:hypothetical protein
MNFTREYYKENYGLEELDPVALKISEITTRPRNMMREIAFFSRQQDMTSSSLVPPFSS